MLLQFLFNVIGPLKRDFFPHPRYRHPIEPEMGMLIVYGLTRSEKKAADNH